MNIMLSKSAVYFNSDLLQKVCVYSVHYLEGSSFILLVYEWQFSVRQFLFGDIFSI